MSIPDSATPKDYAIIIYNKTEILEMNAFEKTRVDTELAKCSQQADEGSPMGVATLDTNGKVDTIQIPFAEDEEAKDPTNRATLMSPERSNALIKHLAVQYTQVGEANGVVPLNYTGQIDSQYLTPTQANQVFVVPLLTDMYELEHQTGTTILISDRCIVTDEGTPSNNGEYVAKFDHPVDASGWGILPNLSAVQSVNGQTGDVTINKTTVPDIQTNYDLSTANSALIGDHDVEIGNLETLTGTHTADISANTGEIVVLQDMATENVSKQYTDIDTLFIPGKYKVHTNLPGTNTQGTLQITSYNDGVIDTVIQRLTEMTDGKEYSRTSVDGISYPVFTEDLLSSRITVIEAAEKSYDYISEKDQSTTLDTFTELARLYIADRPTGVYEVKLSMTYTYSSTVRGAHAQWSLNGGSTWEAFRHEVNDVGDANYATYIFPYSHTSGVIDIVLQYRSEQAGDIFDVQFVNIIFERKA